MTPFEKAGYTKDTKFKVLKDYSGMRKGDIVILEEDDGSTEPYFTKEGCSNFVEMCLPDQGDELEVYEERSEDTPKPVTRNTKINVELTVEEAIATYVVVGTIGGGDHFRKTTSGVYHTLDQILAPICETTDVIRYFNVPGINADTPISGSFEELLDAMLPNEEKQNTLKEIEELRNKLAELEAKVEGMD